MKWVCVFFWLVGMNWVWVDEEGRFFVSELVPMGHGYLLGVWTLAPRDTTTSELVVGWCLFVCLRGLSVFVVNYVILEPRKKARTLYEPRSSLSQDM
jgi:hypothetical protein